ncbi:hypothetical protein PI124_g16964 [Phytophthora idaei]|nr:hypothetical protein PI125_g17251 [Phytophthora idaei]KAG3139797.1 hypothetical protein PI126_g16303 [Phytophthora idaei]KAG3238066.1 hypothetical protein PI124_g16964 [Phytophthora idaei]
MNTKASCRKFLDAVATKLADLYDFHCSFGVPTIGDVFHAIDECKWCFRSVNCKQLTDKPLPGFFNESEWKMLRELDTRTNQRIHDGESNTGWQIVLRCPATHPRMPSTILY